MLPAPVLQETAKLMDQRGGPVISQPELDIFRKIAAGHADQCDTVDALLTISRITDPKQRQLYTKKINTIVEVPGKRSRDLRRTPTKPRSLAITCKSIGCSVVM